MRFGLHAHRKFFLVSNDHLFLILIPHDKSSARKPIHEDAGTVGRAVRPGQLLWTAAEDCHLRQLKQTCTSAAMAACIRGRAFSPRSSTRLFT